MSRENLFAKLWTDYTSLNPEAKRIYDSLVARGEIVQNDHVAYRTFDHEKVSLAKFQKLFEKWGYHKKEEYTFTEKKLFAIHMESATEPKAPKVFISQLETKSFSPWLQSRVSALVQEVPESITTRDDLLTSGQLWRVSHADYQKLLDESEYAAWLSAFGFRPNHFTVYFNALKTFGDLKDLNDFISAQGFQLNTAGGLIKGTPSDLLEQSSTMAKPVKVKFTDGTFEVPACYYEFARRYNSPNGQEFSGFIAKSADKIFESTNRLVR